MGFLTQYEERPEGGRVARLTIDNEAKLNSLSSELMGEIIATMEGLAADPELRLAILTGAGGRAFAGGADLAEIAALDHAGARQFITLVHRCCDAFARLPVPVIARIDGFALGAGLELAVACDLRVASENSAFGMPEVRVGIPSVVEAALLPRLISDGRARRLLLTGETIGAAEALAWGLIDALAPADRLDDAVERLAQPILAAGPQAIRLQKSLIREWQELPTEAAIARGIDAFVSAFDSDEPARMAGAALARMRATGGTQRRSRRRNRALTIPFALLAASMSARAATDNASAMLFYSSCMAAADIMSGPPSPSNPQAGSDDLEKAPMCLGAITAITNLEPLLKPEFAMCPPSGVSFGQIVLVVANYLRNHPEQLHENFHRLAVTALG